MNKIPLRLEFKVHRKVEAEIIVLHSPQLDISAYGATDEEALKNFNDTLGLLFEHAAENGRLEDVFYKLGWKKNEDPKATIPWTPPQKTITTNIDVPVIA